MTPLCMAAKHSTRIQRWVLSLLMSGVHSNVLQQMSDGVIGLPDQLYASPIAMDTMSMFMYPSVSPAPPQYSGLSQYPYDNMRIPQSLESNYVPISPHYEVLQTNSSRAMDFGVRVLLLICCFHHFFNLLLSARTQVDPHLVRPQRFSEPWISYPGIQTPSPIPDFPRRASTSAVPSSTARRSGSQLQLVPHRPYPPPHSKTKGQYVDDATLQPPILFDLIGGTQHGIAAKDAMNKRYHNLVGRDDPMFEESGSSVALRFEVSHSVASVRVCRVG